MSNAVDSVSHHLKVAVLYGSLTTVTAFVFSIHVFLYDPSRSTLIVKDLPTCQNVVLYQM